MEAALLGQAKPNGYTIGTLTTFAITLIPHQREAPYKALKDFTPIIQVGLHPLGLCVKPDSPWKTLKEFIDYARNNPEKISYSTTGTGQSPAHPDGVIGKKRRESGGNTFHIQEALMQQLRFLEDMLLQLLVQPAMCLQ